MALTLNHKLAVLPLESDAVPVVPSITARDLKREHKRLARLGLAGDCDCKYCA